MRPLPIVVLGAGAWGTALAVAASARHPVLLSEVNFQAMFEAQQAQRDAAAAGTMN